MNRHNADLGGNFKNTKIILDKKYRLSRTLLCAVSGIALIAASIGLSQTAFAANGGGGISSGTPQDGAGGTGGIDGDPAYARGKDAVLLVPGKIFGGGGGATNLTTGQGMSGGSRAWINGSPLPDGTTGSTTKINESIVSGVVTGGTGLVNGAGGGGGGVGVSTNVDLTVDSNSIISGGNGASGQGSSGGGGGGVAIFSAKNVDIGSGAKITGGSGGGAANSSGGGGGAAAVLLTGGGTLTNDGTITGGAGGRGANPAQLTIGGAGGNGGEGVLLTNGGTVINNTGAIITGGAFGTNGSKILDFGVLPSEGGSGIVGANVNVINAGIISGATKFGGGIVDAIKFTSGKNSLEIHSTSVINGNVQAFSSDDKLILGGTDNATFDVTKIGETAQYRDFGNFEKTGTSVWTLTGTNTGVTPWTLSGGKLSIATDGSLGDATGVLTFNGGTLLTTDTLAMNRNVSLTAAGGTIETLSSTTLTINGIISGAGGLTKTNDGTLVLTGENTYSGGTTISSGTLQLGNGGTSGSITGNVANSGTLAFNRTNTLTFSGVISGSGQVLQSGTGVTQLSGLNTYTGKTSVESGALAAGGANVLSASSAHSVSTGATLDLAGYNQRIASLSNAGTLSLRGAGNAVGTVLTITGDYTGTNGTILLNAALEGDNSKTDRLIINGNTSGNTNLRVNNISSTGGVTVEGIKLIDVGGTSEGTFVLQGDYTFEGSQAVVSGAYAYRLYKNGVKTPADGDWYLRSTLKDKAPLDPSTPGTPLYNPAVPVFEAYAGALLNLNNVSTLQQRAGNRYLNDGTPAQPNNQDKAAQNSAPAIWGRVEAAHSKFQPKTTTSSTDYDIDTVKMEAGLDGQLYENTNGKLIGGFSAHYTNASADAKSLFGSGKIDIKGYGIGSTLTWYGETGFYVDGQAQATWYNSDLFSNNTKRGLANSNDAFGYVLSIETGKRFALNPSLNLTPQAQLVYSSVDFDSFDTAYISGSSHTSLGKADSLKARFGIAAEHQNSWVSANGKTTRTNIYGIANLYQEFLNGTNVNVSGTNFASENDRTWGGIGTGGSYTWDNDKYALYGEVSYNTSLSNFADSYSVNGKAGFKVAF